MITMEQAIERVAERTYENTQDIKKIKLQRRTPPVDIYGMEFTRQGGPGAPATFYISISPDMVYLERFEFKLIIQPFLTTSGTSTGESEVTIEETSIIPSDYARVEGDTLYIDHSTVIDPHTHTVNNHSHRQTPGAGLTPVTASDFLISVEGIDVTPYLMAQYGTWINGEGVYPSINLNEDYDLLEVASDFVAEGRKEDAHTITKAGYKQVQITSNSLFSVTMVLYLKYPHCNR